MSQQNLDDSLLPTTYQKTDPFLWIHIALLAAFPLVMVLCMMGLAVGDPVLPGWLEMMILGLPPIALTVWLQWQKPLYPFSLWVLAKPVSDLNENQRRVLTILRRRINGWYTGAWVAIVAGVFLYVVFRQMYITAPLAADIAPFPPVLRLIGILWAEVFFLIGNLLLQMGVAAARAMLVPPSEFNSLKPYESDRISKDFTILGMRSPQLLGFITEPLAPIQQTAELITDQPEPAQLPSATAKPGMADKIKPLLTQLSGVGDTLSGLLHKITTLLPSKPATKSKHTPVSPVVPVTKPPVPTDSAWGEVPSPLGSDEVVTSTNVTTEEVAIKVEAEVEAEVAGIVEEVGETAVESPPIVSEVREEIAAEVVHEMQAAEEVTEEIASASEEASVAEQVSTSDTSNMINDTQTTPESISEPPGESGETHPTENRSNDDDEWV